MLDLARLRRRRLLVAPLLGLIALSLIVTMPGPASASSASNPAAALAATPVWSPAAAEMANRFVANGTTELSAADRAAVAGVTAKGAAATGFRPVPRPGPLGMVVNTVGILGAIGAFSFLGGDDDEVDLPTPAQQASASGSASCGWTVVGGGSLPGTCSASQNPIRLDILPSINGTSSEYGLFNVTTGQFAGVCGLARSYCLMTRSSTGMVAYDVYKGINGNSAAQFMSTPSLGRAWVPQLGSTLQNPQPGNSGDPSIVPRYIDATANCKKADGTYEIVTQRVGPFTITPGQPMEIPGVHDLVCPPGTWLESGSHKLDSGAGLPKIDVTEPYHAPDWVGDAATRYPECMPVGAENCLLHLVKIVNGTDSELDCDDVAPGANHPCRDWYTDPNRTDKYKCMYGSNVMTMKSCEPYARTYTSTPTYTETPAEETTPRTDVDPTPLETPGLGGCAPNWGIGLLNPWWVMKSTACALVWAFVPTTDMGLSTLLTTLQTRPPGSLVVGLGSAVHAALSGFTGGGCGVLGGIPLPGEDFTVSCPQIRSMQGYGLVYSGFEFLIYGSGIFAAFRMITGAVRQGGDG